MTCIGWCVELEIDWNAWAAIGTLAAVIVALFQPIIQKCKADRAAEVVRKSLATDVANMMFPLLSEIESSVDLMESQLAKARKVGHFVNDFNRPIVMGHLEDLRGFLNYADALPLEVRAQLAQIFGWGKIWNGLVKSFFLDQPPFALIQLSNDQMETLEELTPIFRLNGGLLKKWCMTLVTKLDRARLPS